jgi:hypothetical protein
VVVGQSATRAVSHPHPVSPRVAGIREAKLRMRRGEARAGAGAGAGAANRGSFEPAYSE